MRLRIKLETAVIACMLLAGASSALAQQKGQWVPGQFGLNAGNVPAPGFTYANQTINYSANRLNDSDGNRILLNVTGTYAFWLNENIIYYVPSGKVLGGYYMPYIALNFASGSLVADLPLGSTNLSAAGGGSGFSDMYVQPLNLGWHLKRTDVNAGYSFVAPTGRYNAGASNNVGSGYWGNNITTGATYYVTKNKGTSANLLTAWEFNHGRRQTASTPQGQFSQKTPGQAFTMEWGIGQVLPLKKDMSKLLQLGVVGYDQWQVSSNRGSVIVAGISVPASTLPYYSVHGIGVQSNFIMPAKNLAAFFKYYDEYSAKARPQGRTFVFGLSWTLRIPKPQPPKT
jgi:hypothetical protein